MRYPNIGLALTEMMMDNLVALKMVLSFIGGWIVGLVCGLVIRRNGD